MSINDFPLAELHSHIAPSIDVFICSSSFEPRCLALSERLNAEKVKQALVAQNENNVHYVGENGKLLLECFKDKSRKVEIDSNDPLKTADGLSKALESVCTDNDQNFLVDISTFTRESLLILVALLRHFLKKTDVLQFVYVGAEKYSYIEETEENKASDNPNHSSQQEKFSTGDADDPQNSSVRYEVWLSRGLREVRSVLGYLGAGLPSRDLHLIILVGFEYERTAQLIDVYEPAVLSLGYSPDETMPGYAEMNKNFHEKVKNLYGGEVQQFTFSAIDPITTRDAITAQVNKFVAYNTVVCAMNTKISTLGAAFAAFADDSIQICYAQAETYNINGYAKPKDRFYLFTPDTSDFIRSRDYSGSEAPK